MAADVGLQKITRATDNENQHEFSRSDSRPRPPYLRISLGRAFLGLESAVNVPVEIGDDAIPECNNSLTIQWLAFPAIWSEPHNTLHQKTALTMNTQLFNLTRVDG
jgi:hypothetical protein